MATKETIQSFNLVAETAIMGHVESISKVWKCNPDGDMQSKTLVLLKSRN